MLLDSETTLSHSAALSEPQSPSFKSWRLFGDLSVSLLGRYSVVTSLLYAKSFSAYAKGRHDTEVKALIRACKGTFGFERHVFVEMQWFHLVWGGRGRGKSTGF